ncbi:MAG: Gfo/Idh/MocA family protein [Chloroflexota bacterium]
MDPVTEPAWRIPDGAGRDLGIGIVGCGGIVRGAHLPAYRAAGLRVVAVHDADPERAAELAREAGIPVVAESVDALVAHPDVAIVDIAVTPQAQPAIAVAAARAGRHILCQKPFALEMAAAKAIVAAADAAGVRCAVNQQMRWDAGIAATRDLVRRGVLGSVVTAELRVSVHSPWHLWPWLAAEPRLEVFYHSIHYLDAFRSILGDPETVTARHGRHPDQGAVRGETRTTTILGYADGREVLVAVEHTDRHGPPRAELRVRGTDGAIDGTIGLIADYPDGGPDTLVLHRAGHPPRAFAFDTRWIPDAFLGPMADLMDAIATGREPVTSGHDNLRTLAVVLAAYRSAETGRTVVVAELL